MGRKVSVAVKLEDLMTVPEAAKILEISRQAAFLAFKKGRIAGYQMGRVIMLARRSVLEYKKTRHAGGPQKV